MSPAPAASWWPNQRAVKAVGLAAAVAIVILVLLWYFQRRLIYFPGGAVGPAEEYLDNARDVTISTTDGRELGAWYVTPQGAERNVTVLVANGNAGNRAGRAPLARELSSAGFTVLLFDYRGYGGNSGSPSERGLARDAEAAYRFLVDEAGTPPERILYFGESLGAGVVAELATKRPPAGLLLRSPFASLASVGQHNHPFLPVRWLLRESYPVADHVAEISVPITVVYGTDDAIVPPSHSRRVAESAAGPVVEVEIDGAGHNDPVMLEGAELLAAVEDLADRAIADD